MIRTRIQINDPRKGMTGLTRNSLTSFPNMHFHYSLKGHWCGVDQSEGSLREATVLQMSTRCCCYTTLTHWRNFRHRLYLCLLRWITVGLGQLMLIVSDSHFTGFKTESKLSINQHKIVCRLGKLTSSSKMKQRVGTRWILESTCSLRNCWTWQLTNRLCERLTGLCSFSSNIHSVEKM